MRNLCKLLSILLLLLSLVTISYAATYSEYGVNITSDYDFYECSPNCTAIVTVKNTNASLGVFPYNVTISNRNAIGSVNYTIEYYNGSDFSSVGITKVADDISQLMNFNLLTDVTHVFKVSMEMYDVVLSKWDFVFNVSNKYGTKEIVLDPLIGTFEKNYTKSSYIVNKYVSSNDINVTYWFNTYDDLTCNFTFAGVVINTTNVTNNTKYVQNINLSSINQANSSWYLSCSNGTLSYLSPSSYIHVDRTSPVITSNLVSVIYTNTTVLFNLTSDDYSNTTCDFYVDGVINNSYSNSYYLQSYNFSEGVHNWTVNCTDGLSQTSNFSGLIYYDLTAPSLMLYDYNSNYATNIVNLNFNVSDNIFTNNSCFVSIDGISYQNISTSSVSNSIKVNLTHQNISNISLACHDDVNFQHTNITNLVVFLDNTSPSISLSHSNNTIINSTFGFDFGVSDNFDSNVSCNFILDNGLNESVNVSSNYVRNITFTEASHTWIFSCSDDLNNTINKTGSVIFDNSNPVINDVSIDDVLINENFMTVNYNVTDLSVNNYVIVLNGVSQSQRSMTGEVSKFNITSLSTGYYNFSIIFEDHAGRQNQSVVSYFSVDLISPTISHSLYDDNNSIVSNTQSNNYMKPNMTLVVNLTDSFTNVSDFWLVYDGVIINTSSINVNDSSINVTFDVGYSGKHKLVINVNDSASNENSREIVFYTLSEMNLSEVSDNLNTITNISSFTFYENNTNVTNMTGYVNSTLDFTFNVDLGGISTLVNITDVDSMGVVWSEDFFVDDFNSDVNQTIYSKGSQPSYIFTVGNLSDFVTGSYDAYMSLNTSTITYDYIYHCPTDVSCTLLSQCSGNSIKNFSGTACYQNNSDLIKLALPSFSSVVFSSDSFVNSPTINSPVSLITDSSFQLDIDFDELVTVDYYVFNGSDNSSVARFVTDANGDYSAYMNETGNIWGGYAYTNGNYTVYFNYTDASGNGGNINTSFELNDTREVSFRFRPEDTSVNLCSGSTSSTYEDEFYLFSRVGAIRVYYNYTDEDNDVSRRGPFYTDDRLYIVADTDNDGDYEELSGHSGPYRGTIEKGETHKFDLSVCSTTNNCTTRTITYTCTPKAVVEDEAEETTTTGGAGITQASVNVNSEQADQLEEIIDLFDVVNDYMDQNKSDSFIRPKLTYIYEAQKDLQADYLNSLELIEELGLDNLTSLGIHPSELEKAKERYELANEKLSSAKSESDVNTKFSILNSVSTQQTMTMYTIPEITKINFFKQDVDVVTELEINNAKTYVVKDNVRELMESINLTKEKPLSVTKNVYVYEIKNEERSTKTLHRSVISLYVHASQDSKEIVVIETIPKSVANHTDDILFDIEPDVILQKDPIVQWNVDDLKKGTSKKLSYVVNSKQTGVKTLTLFDTESELVNVVQEDFEELNGEEVENEITSNAILSNESQEAINDEFDFKPNWVIISAIATLLVFGAIGGIFVVVKKSSHKHKKVNRTHVLKKVKEDQEKRRRETLESIISDGLKKGLTISEIKAELVEKGWPNHIIEHVLENLSFGKRVKYKMNEK